MGVPSLHCTFPRDMPAWPSPPVPVGLTPRSETAQRRRPAIREGRCPVKLAAAVPVPPPPGIVLEAFGAAVKGGSDGEAVTDVAHACRGRRGWHKNQRDISKFCLIKNLVAVLGGETAAAAATTAAAVCCCRARLQRCGFRQRRAGEWRFPSPWLMHGMQTARVARQNRWVSLSFETSERCGTLQKQRTGRACLA